MSGRILVLGAAGKLGHAAAEAFRDAGWIVVSLVRPGARARAPQGTQVVEAHALDRVAVSDAAHDADVVLHALNPPYTGWDLLALPLAYAAIDAAEKAGATLLFPGNLYNFGKGLPAVIDESTPTQPSARKGQIRVLVEQRIREATERGLRAVVLRAGDFFGGGRGSWLDLVIAKDLSSGTLTYPGPFDLVHEWSYVPDLAQAFVRVTEMRADLPTFEVFGFPGHAVTGREFLDAIAQATPVNVTGKRMSWWMVHALSPFVKVSRELSEIAYLWHAPHQIAGDKLKRLIGEVPHTPLKDAVRHAIQELARERRA
jgi:nucleoside-diphosphate-sugar epimerase